MNKKILDETIKQLLKERPNAERVKSKFSVKRKHSDKMKNFKKQALRCGYSNSFNRILDFYSKDLFFNEPKKEDFYFDKVSFEIIEDTFFGFYKDNKKFNYYSLPKMLPHHKINSILNDNYNTYSIAQRKVNVPFSVDKNMVIITTFSYVIFFKYNNQHFYNTTIYLNHKLDKSVLDKRFDNFDMLKNISLKAYFEFIEYVGKKVLSDNKKTLDINTKLNYIKNKPNISNKEKVLIKIIEENKRKTKWFNKKIKRKYNRQYKVNLKNLLKEDIEKILNDDYTIINDKRENFEYKY